MSNSVQEAILKRRSIREYTDEPVSRELLRRIVTAGTWAPSGLNNQPWRFVLVDDRKVIKEMAETTHYGHIVRAATALIVVYLDERAMYDAVKDHQSAGACIQNMLLAAHELGLGAVWLGQILKNKDEVSRILEVDHHHDLMAVLAVGWPLHGNWRSQRKGLEEFILKEI